MKNISRYKYRYQSSGNFEISYNRRVEGFRDLPGYLATNNFFVKWNHLQDPKARPNQIFLRVSTLVQQVTFNETLIVH